MSEKKTGCLIQVLKWLNFLLIIVTGISFAAPYFSPSIFWPFIFLGMGFPILILLNIAYILFWLYLKKWYFIFSLMCVLISWSGGEKFIGNPFKSIKIKKGKSIQIMTYNAREGGLYANKTYKQFIDFVLEKDCDIICFQELNINNKKFANIKERYPHFKKRNSQCILSKYPIIDHKDLNLENKSTSNGALWVDVQVDNNQIIRIYNVHLHSNGVSSEVDELSENTELNELNDKAKWNATKGILAQVKNAAAVRAEQSLKVKKSMNASPYPIILCGDFNDPPQSYTYRKLSKDLKDTFAEAGKGFGFTYNGNIPFLKIDYILVSPSLGVSSTKIISSDLSDHKPIISTLVLPIK